MTTKFEREKIWPIILSALKECMAHDKAKQSEQRIMADMLSDKWKGKYTVDFCHLCQTVILICPDCGNTTCNCGGCPKCHDDFVEFGKYKTHVEAYMTPEEAKAYQKGIRLQKHMVEGFQRQQTELNFKVLKSEGHLSLNDQELFGV